MPGTQQEGRRHVPTKRGRKHVYRCMVDNEEHDREDLLVKKIVYMEMGRGARTVRSRAVGWICRDHAEVDPDWNREPWIEAPGHTSVEE